MSSSDLLVSTKSVAPWFHVVKDMQWVGVLWHFCIPVLVAISILPSRCLHVIVLQFYNVSLCIQFLCKMQISSVSILRSNCASIQAHSPMESCFFGMLHTCIYFRLIHNRSCIMLSDNLVIFSPVILFCETKFKRKCRWICNYWTMSS